MLSLNQQKYTIIKPIGEGMYGIVYKVQNALGQVFAYKKYINENGEEGIPLGALREISILKKLQKIKPYPKNIIQLHDIIILPESIGIIIPYYQTSLGTAIKRKMLSIQQKNHIFLGILIGLMWLMTCKILHRDIKPDNIMIDDHMNPIIIDFSIGNNCDNTANVCSFVYKPPEIFEKKPYSFSLDMWSLGVMMLEMYTDKIIYLDERSLITEYLNYKKYTIIENSYFFLLKDILVNEPSKRFTPFQCINLLKPQYTFPCIAKSSTPTDITVSPIIQNICQDYQAVNSNTPLAAQIYSDTVDSSYNQIVVILACKFYEKEPVEIQENFFKEELEIFKKREFNLFIE